MESASGRWYVELVESETGVRDDVTVEAATKDEAIASALRAESLGMWADLPLRPCWEPMIVVPDAEREWDFERSRIEAERLEAVGAEPPAEWEADAPDDPADDEGFTLSVETWDPRRSEQEAFQADLERAIAAVDAEANAGAGTSTNPEAWNRYLVKWGLGTIQHRRENLDREFDRRCRVRSSKQATGESQLIYSEFGGLTTIHDVPIDGPKNTRGKERPASAVTVTKPGSEVTYLRLKSDTDALAAELDREGKLAAYRSALGRGRPTPEQAAVRAELATRVVEMRRQGATVTGIASVLGCHRNAVANLEKRAA